MSEENYGKALEFLKLVGRLKHLPRTGWVLRNVQKPETVAGHMYRMAMMMFLVNDPLLDKTRCMEMALVHDLGESIVGDITPHCGVSKEEKHKKECEAIEYISNLIGKNGEQVKELFMEFEEQKTKESHLVKELDLFDMALQASEYEVEEGNPGRLQEFINSTSGKFSHPLILSLNSEMLKQREKELSKE